MSIFLPDSLNGTLDEFLSQEAAIKHCADNPTMRKRIPIERRDRDGMVHPGENGNHYVDKYGECWDDRRLGSIRRI